MIQDYARQVHEGQRHQESARAKDEQRRSMSAQPVSQAKKALPNPNIPAPQLKNTQSDAEAHAPDWYESYAVDAKAPPRKEAGHASHLNDSTHSHRSVVPAAASIPGQWCKTPH